jgi:hypothetical protein
MKYNIWWIIPECGHSHQSDGMRAPRAVTHVTLQNGLRVEVSLDGGELFAVVNSPSEEDLVWLLREAVRTFGADNVRKVNLFWARVQPLDLDGPLFTALRGLPRLVSLAVQCNVRRAGALPWPNIRSLRLDLHGNDMALIALFPRLERMATWSMNATIPWVAGETDNIVRIMTTLPDLHSIDVVFLCEHTAYVLRVPALRRVVAIVHLPVEPAVLAGIRDRATLPGAERLMLSLDVYDLDPVPGAGASLQDLCLAATLGGVTLDLRCFSVLGVPLLPEPVVDGGGMAERLRLMRRRDAAARVIQRHFLARYYDPSDRVCRKRLRREFDELAHESGH